MATASQHGRILELDGLRALAVLAVVAFHYTLGTAWANPVTGLGWAGVDLFFVLSGYLITSILISSRRRPGYFSTFYARRTLRIFPVYYCLLAIYAASAVIWGGPQPWRYWAMHALYLSSVAEYFHTWMFAAPTFVYAGLAVLWSLSIEELFYLMWAPVVRWVRPQRLWWVLAAAIVAAPVLRFAMHNAHFPEYEFLPARCDSLAWGAALALLLGHAGWRTPRVRAGLARLGLGAAAALAVLLVATGGGRDSLAMATLGYTLLASGFAGLVGWTVLSAGRQAGLCRLLRLRPARQLGTISYTTYLVHYPVLALVIAAAAWWPGVALSSTPGLIVRDGLSLVVALGVAAASWRWFEHPILRLKDRWRPALSRVAEPSAPAVRIVQTE